jgi:ribosomal protein S18 acetylase RimI-like enzyme
MAYTCRLATSEDALAIAPLWANFAKDRAEIDPSMTVKPDFDFEKYIVHQLAKSLSYCWILEHQEAKEIAIAGCLLIYFYDEAPPPELPEALQRDREFDNPFCDRRVGSVLGMYVHPEHRQPEAIKLLADAGIQKAEEMKVSDIDLLVGADQTGMHALLKRVGFTQSAIQYTKHYDIPADTELPDLHPPHPEFEDLPEIPQPGAIPLRDLQTNELIKNTQGEPVFLAPLQNENGDRIRTSQDLPIYPTPVRNPQTQEYVFDPQGNLIVCPVLRDENGAIAEYQDIPQFHPPAYQAQNGKLHLKQDEKGNYIFCEVERDKEGKILRNPSGQPIFKQSFPIASKI